MKTTVSVRGQTVVPLEIRKRMGIVPQTKWNWQIGKVVHKDPEYDTVTNLETLQLPYK